MAEKVSISVSDNNTHYFGETRVVDISKRSETIRMEKNEEGKFIPVKRDLGWFVTIEPNITFRFGNDEPELNKGDKLYVLLVSPEE